MAYSLMATIAWISWANCKFGYVEVGSKESMSCRRGCKVGFEIDYEFNFAQFVLGKNVFVSAPLAVVPHSSCHCCRNAFIFL